MRGRNLHRRENNRAFELISKLDKPVRLKLGESVRTMGADSGDSLLFQRTLRCGRRLSGLCLDQGPQGTNPLAG